MPQKQSKIKGNRKIYDIRKSIEKIPVFEVNINYGEFPIKIIINDEISELGVRARIEFWLEQTYLIIREENQKWLDNKNKSLKSNDPKAK